MGCLLYTNGSAPVGGDTAALLTLEYLETHYDYYLQKNATYLKTTLILGSVIDFEPIFPKATLTGYSLAALYSTLLLTTAQETVFMLDSGKYNSSLAEQPALPMNTANITGATTAFYNFLFNESYTLHSLPSETYPTTTSACPSTSLHPHVPKKQFTFPLNIFQGFSLAFLPRITNSAMAIDFDYQQSGLLYRVNYPYWNGSALTHDPTYIAHLGSAPPFPPPSPGPPSWLFPLIVVTLSGILILVITVLLLPRVKEVTDGANKQLDD